MGLEAAGVPRTDLDDDGGHRSLLQGGETLRWVFPRSQLLLYRELQSPGQRLGLEAAFRWALPGTAASHQHPLRGLLTGDGSRLSHGQPSEQGVLLLWLLHGGLEHPAWAAGGRGGREQMPPSSRPLSLRVG